MSLQTETPVALCLLFDFCRCQDLLATAPKGAQSLRSHCPVYMMLPFSDSDFATMVDSSFTRLSSISAPFYCMLQTIEMQFFQGVITVADKALSPQVISPSLVSVQRPVPHSVASDPGHSCPYSL